MKNPFLCGVLAASLFAVNSLIPAKAQEAVSASAIDFYDGKIRPKSGAKYNMRVFIRSKVTQTVPIEAQKENLGFKKIETVSIIKFNADYDIVSVDALGNHQARVTYGAFDTDTSAVVDGQAQPQALKAASKKQANEFLKVMNGITFLVKISPTNKVISVYGLDVMRAKLLKKFASISPESGAVANSMLSNFLSDKNATKVFGNLGGEIPAQPIRVSESWNYSVPEVSTKGFELIGNGVRTLVSLKDGVATIKDSAKITRKGQNNWMPKGPSLDTIDSVNGITRITNATGVPLDSTVIQTMRGTIAIPFGQKKIPLEFSSVNETRLVIEEE